MLLLRSFPLSLIFRIFRVVKLLLYKETFQVRKETIAESQMEEIS